MIAILALIGVGLACALPDASQPPPTSTPTASPSPSPTPTSTPTPTPAPAELLLDAERARFYGDWDTALLEYQQVLAEGAEPGVTGAAQLGIGQTLMQAGRPAEAAAALNAFIDGYPQHERLAQAYLLRAQAWMAQAMPGLAVEDYAAFLARRPGVIDAYVEEWLADALLEVGRPAEAAAHYQAAAELPGLGSIARLKLRIGWAWLSAGDPAASLSQADQVYQSSADAELQASANYLAGQAYEAMGDTGSAVARYLDSVQSFPAAYDAYLGLIRLVELGAGVDEFQRGLVDYNAGALEPALAAFNRLLSASESAAGYYYRGLTLRALGNAEAALLDFQEVTQRFGGDPIWAEALWEQARTEWGWLDRYSAAIDSFLLLAAQLPDHRLAPEALSAAGRTAERIQELGRAAEIWLRLPAEYPNHPLAFRGAFMAGIARYRAGDYLAAREAMLLANAQATNSADLAASWFWEAKTHAQQGDPAAAELALQRAAAADPTGYYSIRAEDQLLGRAPFAWVGGYHFSTDLTAERMQAEGWLRETFGIAAPEPLHELDATLANDRRMIRGLELWELGLYDLARAEFEALRSAVEQDPLATYRLMHKLLEIGLYRPAIFAARQILRLAGMDDAATLQAPVYFNRIRFGAYFGDLILPEAARQGFEGLFLLSVVRQESLFEGFATSYAAARGLMQVIPSTGQSLAEQIGWPPDYTAADLYRPLVSVRLGTHYLAAQRDRFGGDLYAALAAYNAGPGNALLWKELAPDDPDLFLEVIRLDQPQLYIRTIYEVYAIYRQLYGAP